MQNSDLRSNNHHNWKVKTLHEVEQTKTDLLSADKFELSLDKINLWKTPEKYVSIFQTKK